MSYNNFVSDDSGLQNSEILYSTIQKVYLKSKSKEEKQRDLRISIELITGGSPVFQQNLSLQLTDDDDPFFLYSFLITEDDFKHVKSQQGLLVDFDHFPNQFVKLLEQCKCGSDSLGPRFLLILDSERRLSDSTCQQTCLKIVETNNFKHLCHLSLKIEGGSDTEIKKLMAVKIKQLKDQVSKCNSQISRAETRLHDVECKFEMKSRDVEDIQKLWSEEKSGLCVQNMHNLNEEREKYAALQLNWQKRLDNEKEEFEEKHLEVVREYETENSKLKSQYQIMFEKHCQLESSKREQSKCVENLEKDLSCMQRELTGLRKQSAKLDKDYHEKDRTVHSLRTKLAVFEQEIKDKGTLLNKQQQLLAVANEQKNLLEDSLAEKESTLHRRQQSLIKLSEDLVKANEIIRKMQNELTDVKAKMRLRTTITLEQERLLDQKQKELCTLQSQVDQQFQLLKQQEASEKTLADSLAAANIKLEEKEKMIKNNDNIINYLNRRLNEVSTQPGSQSGHLLSTSTPTGLLAQINTSAGVPTNTQSQPRSHERYLGSKVSYSTPSPLTQVIPSTLDPKYFKPAADNKTKNGIQEENKQASNKNVCNSKVASSGVPASIERSKEMTHPPQRLTPSSYFPKTAPF